MSNWYEVFDNEEVQRHARTQATHLTVVTALTVVITLIVATLGYEAYLSFPTVGILLAATWLFSVRWVAQRMRRLRRLVWCIKLSEERIVGYDYTRRKAVMTWDRVERVDLSDQGLLLAGPNGSAFEIPHLFPDFPELSHRIVHYAEMNGIPVYIEGLPWQELNVYRLFPFLTENGSPGTPTF